MGIKLQREIWISPKASQKLKSLKPVFERLVSVHQRFIDDCGDDDCPYWYAERPHIGFLAAAVWLEPHGIALEEYSVKKLKQRKHKRARGDLYINILKTSFECEAKCVPLNLGGNTEALATNASKGLQEARKDVKKHEDKKGLALCFLTLRIRRSKLSTMDMKLRELRKSIREKSGCDALVWIGVSEGNKLWGKDWFFTGVVLAIVEVT